MERAPFAKNTYSGVMDRKTSFQHAHATFDTRARDNENKRRDAARRQRDNRRLHAHRRINKINALIAEIEEEKALTVKRLTKQLADIETERQDTYKRLTEWMEDERRMLEERIARHVASEQQAVEERLLKKVQEIEEEMKLLEKRIEKHIFWQKEQLKADEEAIDSAEADLEESDNGRQEFLKCMDKFSKQFEQAASTADEDLIIWNFLPDGTHKKNRTTPEVFPPCRSSRNTSYPPDDSPLTT